MHSKKDDFEKHLDKYAKKNPNFLKKLDKETDKLRIAVKIAQLREENGLSQKQLAKKIHTTQSVVSRLENSSYENYSIRTLKKIAEIFHLKLIIDFQ